MDRCTITVQPAGPVGRRHVFLSLAFEDDTNARQVELVLSERAADRLGHALISGSVGLERNINLAIDPDCSAMPRDFFNPSEQQSVVLINSTTLREAERLIKFCEGCTREGAEIPFDVVLDRVTGSDPNVTHYILEMPARCPHCLGEVFKKTLIEPK